MTRKLIAGLATGAFLLAGVSCASATMIASTNFDGRTVSGPTASNLTWILNGVSATSSLTATHNLFDTVAAQNRFAVDRNLHSEGEWFLDISLNVLAENNIDLGLLSLDALIFNNAGNLQNMGRDLDLNFTLFDSADNLLASVDNFNIFPPDGSITQPQAVSFDFTGNTLAAGGLYSLKLTASGNGPGNNAGFDNLQINGELSPASNPVPEPATMLFFGTGLAGLVGIRRKKK
jgi:hypothetical protein